MIYCEYTLVEGEEGLICPLWIDNGGYWLNTDNDMIGAVEDENEGNIPGSINRLTAQQVEDRQVAMHNVTPNQKENVEEDGHIGRVDMTESEVRTSVQKWVAVGEQESGYHLDNLILDGTDGSSTNADDKVLLG